MSKKSKIGSAGRFGVRYGQKDRSKVAEIEKIQKQSHVCPRCGLPHVTRLSSGIWTCKKCGNKFAGPAYLPYTIQRKERR
jgi:large subunit ribosomal protein L37Ae